jgi:hypothetical protein
VRNSPTPLGFAARGKFRPDRRCGVSRGRSGDSAVGPGALPSLHSRAQALPAATMPDVVAASPAAAASSALDAKRADVAERVRVARAEKMAVAKAEAKVAKEAAKAAQVQVLYKDHGVFFEDEKAAIEHQRASTEKVKGFRKQQNFGATKFIKP